MSSRAVTHDWRSLADKVIKRRTQLGMTQQDVQAAGGPATATLRNIEGAHQTSYRGVILSRLEKALEWQPGSIDAILAGGEPTPASAAHPAPPEPAEPAAPPKGKTLGDVLVERGLRRPEDLVISDEYHVAGDRALVEILEASEFDEAFKNRWLSAYSNMRRAIFEGARQQMEKPRDI